MPIEPSVLHERRSRRVAYVTSIALVGLAAFIFGRMTAPEGAPDQPSGLRPSVVASPNSSDDAPSAERTETAAVGAATRFARIMGSIRVDDAGYVAAMEAIAAPSWRDEARELARAGVDVILQRYGRGGTSTFMPLRYRVTKYDQTAAVVEIWGVGVSGGATGRLESTWGIGTFRLTWVRDEWMLAGAASSRGPAPTPLGAPGATPTSLDAFAEYRDAPTP
jgi:hypothetical protein